MSTPDRATIARALFPLALAAAVLAAGYMGGWTGDASAYVRLGLFPGMALAAWLPLADGRARMALGLALSPLVAVLAGWLCLEAGLGLGPAGVLVFAAGAFVWTVARLWRPAAAAPAGATLPGSVLLLGCAWAALIVAVAVANPHVPYRSDAWYHGGIVWNIIERSIPPEDPRFAGLPANYMWIYHLFIALQTVSVDGNPFRMMTLFNIVNVATCTWMAGLAGMALWRERGAAAGTALLVTLGFSAGAWILSPLRGVRGLIGQTRGWSHVLAEYRGIDFDSWHVLDALTPPFAHMVSFADKFIVSTALSYAWILLLTYLWALAAHARGGRAAPMLVLGLAALGMMLFHGVVGLAVIPVAIAVLGLMTLMRLPLGAPYVGSRAPLAVTALAAALGAPYLWSITRGWTPAHSGLEQHLLQPSFTQTVTLVTALAFAFALAWAPARRAWRDREPAATLMALFALGLAGVALIVNLPDDNESKLVFLAFVPVALLGGRALVPWLGRVRHRTGIAGVALVIAWLFVLAPLLVARGVAVDPEQHTAPEMRLTPGARALYAWIRTSTPRDAMFVDAEYRDLVMVLGHRPVLLGTRRGPEKAGYPLSQVLKRRAVMEDLYGAAGDLDADFAVLEGLKRPVYLIYRDEDGAGAVAALRALEDRPDLATVVHAADGVTVLAANASR